MVADVKQRARNAARLELAHAAFDVILDKGFDRLTVDDIAAGIGMSRATFFRQFGTKEGAIIAALIGTSAQFAEAYRAVSPSEVSSRWAHLRHAVEPAVLFNEANVDRSRRRVAFLAEHDTIAARLRQERVPQIRVLAEAMVDMGENPMTAGILANAAVATIDQCFMIWMAEDKGDLRSIVDRAFAALDVGSLPLEG